MKNIFNNLIGRVKRIKNYSHDLNECIIDRTYNNLKYEFSPLYYFVVIFKISEEDAFNFYRGKFNLINSTLENLGYLKMYNMPIKETIIKALETLRDKYAN